MWSERSVGMAMYLVHVTETVRYSKWVNANSKFEAQEAGYDDAEENGLDDYEVTSVTTDVWVGNNI